MVGKGATEDEFIVGEDVLGGCRLLDRELTVVDAP